MPEASATSMARFAGETQTDVVFRQHYFADALPVLRLVFADPQEFREREIRQRRIAGQLDEAFEADGAIELFRLRFRPLITPDERGANDFVVFIEQDGAVHLAGETDSGDGTGIEAGKLQRFANGQSGRAPPVARVLLRPARLRAGKVGVLFRAGGEDRAEIVENDGARAAGSDVDAQDRNDGLLINPEK